VVEQGVLDTWLAASIILLLLQQAFLWVFLRRKHVQMRHLYVGTPGYLEHLYIRWCREHGRGYLTMIIVRVVLILSIIVAVLAIQIALKAVALKHSAALTDHRFGLFGYPSIVIRMAR
jgi:hypothetical protein